MATTEHRVIGQPVGRADGPEKVTGAGKYSIDVVPPGTLWCKVLRSPYAHARIVSIDASAALALPGVHAVITGKDVEGQRWGKTIQDEPIIAWDRALYIGDKVAAVAADDEETADTALSLIDVEYEELPAIVTIAESRAPDAPILHPDFNTYAGVMEQLDGPSNAVVHNNWSKGDVAAGMAEADLIIERDFETSRTHQLYLEPHNCVVAIDDDGTVQTWIGTKSPMSNRASIAALTGRDISQVVINFAYVGGDFGGKGDIVGVPICYALAEKTGRPVKFAMDYSEELMAMNPRHRSEAHVKVGVKRDGTITAWESDIYFNAGGVSRVLAERQSARRERGCRAVPHSQHAHRYVADGHEHRPWRLPTRPGRGAGHLCGRVHDGHRGGGAGHGPRRVPPQERGAGGG